MTDADLNIKRASPFFGMKYWLEFTNGVRGCQGNDEPRSGEKSELNTYWPLSAQSSMTPHLRSGQVEKNSKISVHFVAGPVD
jgi:hypothetical protein